jgi:hypothetical protein
VGQQLYAKPRQTGNGQGIPAMAAQLSKYAEDEASFSPDPGWRSGMAIQFLDQEGGVRSSLLLAPNSKG